MGFLKKLGQMGIVEIEEPAAGDAADQRPGPGGWTEIAREDTAEGVVSTHAWQIPAGCFVRVVTRNAQSGGYRTSSSALVFVPGIGLKDF